MGHWKIPDRYPFAEVVGPDGSRCSTCYYLSKDGEHCRNKLYKEATGTRDLGGEADEFCCLVWSSTRKTRGAESRAVGNVDAEGRLHLSMVVESRGPGREESIVKKTKGGWVVISPRTHKRLGGPYRTKGEALKRLRQVEYYKRAKKK